MKGLRYVEPIVLRLLLAIGVIATVVDLIEFVQVMGMFGYNLNNPVDWLYVITDWFFGVNLTIQYVTLQFPAVWPALLLVTISTLGYNLSLKVRDRNVTTSQK